MFVIARSSNDSSNNRPLMRLPRAFSICARNNGRNVSRIEHLKKKSRPAVGCGGMSERSQLLSGLSSRTVDARMSI